MSGHDVTIDSSASNLVVFLHGGSSGRSPWADSARSWKEIAAHLEGAGYQCILVDRPGHAGEAVASVDQLTFEHELAVVAGVISQNGGRAHVVGHAEAGITCLLLAQRDTQRRLGVEILSCSVVAGHGAEPTADGPERVILSDPPLPAWSAASQRWAVRRLTFAGDSAADDYQDPGGAETARASAQLLAARDAAARVANDLLKAKGQIFAYAREPGYDVPISLTWGMSDPLSEPPRAVELMKLLATTTAHLELNLVDRAGHFVHRERPSEVGRLLSGFLSRSCAT